MAQSNFQKVVRLNLIAGNGGNAGWPAIKKQFKLIDLEHEELRKAIDEGDLTAIRDAAADVLVTTHGLFHRMGADGEADFNAVTDALMSRFDLDLINAAATKEKYLAIGVLTNIRQVNYEGVDYYVTISATNQTGTDGENYPEGKWLKSVNTVSPTFAPLPAEVIAKLA